MRNKDKTAIEEAVISQNGESAGQQKQAWQKPVISCITADNTEKLYASKESTAFNIYGPS